MLHCVMRLAVRDVSNKYSAFIIKVQVHSFEMSGSVYPAKQCNTTEDQNCTFCYPCVVACHVLHQVSLLELNCVADNYCF